MIIWFCRYIVIYEAVVFIFQESVTLSFVEQGFFILQKGWGGTGGAVFIFPVFIENLACESKAHEEIIHRDAYRHSRQESKGLAHELLENSHKAGLQAHVEKMAQREAETLLSVGLRVESEIARQEEIDYETQCIAYHRRWHSLHLKHMHEYHVETILQQSGYGSHNSKSDYFRKPAVAVD